MHIHQIQGLGAGKCRTFIKFRAWDAPFAGLASEEITLWPPKSIKNCLKAISPNSIRENCCGGSPWGGSCRLVGPPAPSFYWKKLFLAAFPTSLEKWCPSKVCCIRLSRCNLSSVPRSLDVSLFLELGCWGEGIALSIAQYVSYGSLVVFVMWGHGAVCNYRFTVSYSSTYGRICIR